MLRKALRAFLYLLYLVVVALGVIEIVGRFLWVSDGEHVYWKHKQLFIYDRNLNYRLKPGFAIAGNDNRLYPGVDIRINDKGLRGPEPDRREAVLLAGDSVVFGFRVPESSAMAARLEHYLGGEQQVMNAGVPGYNLEQISLWTRELVDTINPRVVILLVNANDAEARYVPVRGGLNVSRFRVYPWETRLPLEQPLQRDPFDHWILSSLVASIQRMEFAVKDLPAEMLDPRSKAAEDVARFDERVKKKIAFWNSGDPGAEERSVHALSAVQALAGELLKQGIQVVVLRYPWPVCVTDPGVDDPMTRQWLKAMQQIPGVTGVDLEPVLAERQSVEPQFLIADNHPSPSGHDTIARELARVLRSIGAAEVSRQPPETAR